MEHGKTRMERGKEESYELQGLKKSFGKPHAEI
jgi:hypothetical protein